MGPKGLRDVWHISLPNSFSKVFERSKIKLPLQKNLLLSLDPAMMVKLIELILLIGLAIQKKLRYSTPRKGMLSFVVELLQ